MHIKPLYPYTPITLYPYTPITLYPYTPTPLSILLSSLSLIYSGCDLCILLALGTETAVEWLL
jgi:hypothetical protein